MNRNALPKGGTSVPNSQRAVSVPESNEAEVLRTTPLDVAFVQALEATLSEWDSAADDAAFKDLA
jgi:hypothetical protein